MLNLRLILFSINSIQFLIYFIVSCDGRNVEKYNLDPPLDYSEELLPLTFETLSQIFVPDWETKPETELHLKATSDSDSEIPELLSATEFTVKNGYPIESHKILTEDGFILTVHRIPHGKEEGSKILENKPVVLLQHGILQSSDDWFRNEAGSGYYFPFLLADENYDVWISNSRGNKYATEHSTFEEDTLEFYNFTFHEMGIYDLPATIDFILAETNQTQLNYIGCSIGTTVFWVTMSTFPDYGDKINFMAALSPVAFMGNTTSPVKTLAPFTDELKGLFVTLRTKRFNPPKLQSIVNTYLPRLCFFRLVSRNLCNSVNKVLKDFGMTTFESHHVKQLAKYAPTTTSIKTMIHFLQLIKSEKFQQYDYGSDHANIMQYGDKFPPLYNITNVNVPVAIFSGVNDAFSHQLDVDHLKAFLPNVVEHVVVNSTFKTHVDYTHEPSAVELIYTPIIKLLSTYTST